MMTFAKDVERQLQELGSQSGQGRSPQVGDLRELARTLSELVTGQGIRNAGRAYATVSAAAYQIIKAKEGRIPLESVWLPLNAMLALFIARRFEVGKCGLGPPADGADPVVWALAEEYLSRFLFKLMCTRRFVEIFPSSQPLGSAEELAQLRRDAVSFIRTVSYRRLEYAIHTSSEVFGKVWRMDGIHHFTELIPPELRFLYEGQLGSLAFGGASSFLKGGLRTLPRRSKLSVVLHEGLPTVHFGGRVEFSIMVNAEGEFVEGTLGTGEILREIFANAGREWLLEAMQLQNILRLLGITAPEAMSLPDPEWNGAVTRHLIGNLLGLAIPLKDEGPVPAFQSLLMCTEPLFGRKGFAPEAKVYAGFLQERARRLTSRKPDDPAAKPDIPEPSPQVMIHITDRLDQLAALLEEMPVPV